MSKVVSLVPRGFRSQLRDAQQQRTLVRVWRDEVEPGSYVGYVMGVGAKFFLLWVLDDDVRPGGWAILRHQDVSEVESPDRQAAFLEQAMAIQGLAPPAEEVAFALDDLQGVLRSCQEQAPVLTLMVPGEAEEEEPPIVLFVGRLEGFSQGVIMLQEISPDGQWLEASSAFDEEEILGVGLYDNYARCLLAVADQHRPLEQGSTARLKLASTKPDHGPGIA